MENCHQIISDLNDLFLTKASGTLFQSNIMSWYIGVSTSHCEFWVSQFNQYHKFQREDHQWKSTDYHLIYECNVRMTEFNMCLIESTTFSSSCEMGLAEEVPCGALNVYSQNSCFNCLRKCVRGGPGWSQRPRIPFVSSKWVAGSQALRPSSSDFLDAFSRSWVRNGTAETQTSTLIWNRGGGLGLFIYFLFEWKQDLIVRTFGGEALATPGWPHSGPQCDIPVGAWVNFSQSC